MAALPMRRWMEIEYRETFAHLINRIEGLAEGNNQTSDRRVYESDDLVEDTPGWPPRSGGKRRPPAVRKGIESLMRGRL